MSAHKSEKARKWRWPWQPRPYTSEEEAGFAEARRQRLRDEAYMDRMIEVEERATIPCDDCQIGEPHVCERAWWEQRADHMRGRECADPDCLCHPETCDHCGQSIPREVLLAQIGRRMSNPPEQRGDA